ncbi:MULTISPECIES: hypothetical protein [Bacillus]|uniref:hypothetical protein n=1 Tax=Bacillus TaxID=1386 RepID=UPI0004231272|nr:MULTISPECIES: hypothetical protein [Bacillus]QHZ45498.1 DUF600 domain-containing protein [Bacillus sp. NSP9.1]
MTKTFEDYLSELQTDMVDICLEYVDNQADAVYIYCSYEPDMYAFDVFYKINGKYVYKHKINDAVEDSEKYDTSENRQEAVLDIGIENLKEIHSKCTEFDHEMPTEIKLIYDVKQNSLKGNYRYDLVYSNDDELLPDDIFDLWFEEVKKSDEEK